MSEALRRAVVSGASSGIGLAIARGLLERGFRVLGLSRRPGPLAVEASFEHRSVDLADLETTSELARELARAETPFELLVSAAGGGVFGSLEELSDDQLRSQFALHAIAPALLCKALLPGMKRAGRGQLVFVGSEAALRGRREGSVYCAAKFALRGLAQALRDECARSGVRVTSVHPGMVRTPFFDDLDFEPGPDRENALLPEHVAAVVFAAIEAPPEAVVDEIEISPLKRVVRKRR